jgi:signal transduction histidine kinase
MVRAFFASGSSRGGDRTDRASILLPFLIISIGLGVLAWRSWQLSERMEHNNETLAQQYASYTSEITARRIDSVVAGELINANEDWQKVERRMSTPTAEALRGWITSHDWIVSAIYVPDADPTSSIYVSEPPGGARSSRLTREFWTPSGTVRFTFDAGRLLAHASGAMHQPMLERGNEIREQARITLVATTGHTGLLKGSAGFAYLAQLAAPLDRYAIRSFVAAAYDGSSVWENPRVISTWVSLIAILLTALGAVLALRGLRKEAETTKLRGALIANVSHELRTPLSMIRLGAETLKRGAKLKEKDRADIEDQILREVLHLSHLVENVLDVARIQNRSTKALSFQPVYPRELVTSLLATYESWIQSKGFELSLSIDESVDEQLWDRDAVSRSVLNLIDNAIKYSLDQKQIAITLRQTEEHVIIEVRDRGIGIAQEDLERIFDPYYRATFSDTQTRRGAGLGLTLVQQIMLSHGGRVDVSSTAGEGSTFSLLFPRPRTTAEGRTIPALAATSYGARP